MFALEGKHPVQSLHKVENIAIFDEFWTVVRFYQVPGKPLQLEKCKKLSTNVSHCIRESAFKN